VHEQGLHHGLGALGRREVGRRRANVVRYQAPQRDVVVDLLWPEVDALAGQGEPDDGAAEGADCGDAVEVVDGHAVLVDGVVVWAGLCEFQDALADAGVQEADADAACEALAAGLDGFERAGALQDVLGCFEEAVAGDVDAEAAGAGEDFDDAVGAHAAEEGLVGETGEGCGAVAVEDVLAAGDLGPVDPWRDGVHFGPQLVEFGVFGVVVMEELVEVAFGLGFAVGHGRFAGLAFCGFAVWDSG